MKLRTLAAIGVFLGGVVLAMIGTVAGGAALPLICCSQLGMLGAVYIVTG